LLSLFWQQIWFYLFVCLILKPFGLDALLIFVYFALVHLK
jgi:hypothetical protein